MVWAGLQPGSPLSLPSPRSLSLGQKPGSRCPGGLSPAEASPGPREGPRVGGRGKVGLRLWEVTPQGPPTAAATTGRRWGLSREGRKVLSSGTFLKPGPVSRNAVPVPAPPGTEGQARAPLPSGTLSQVLPALCPSLQPFLRGRPEVSLCSASSWSSLASLPLWAPSPPAPLRGGSARFWGCPHNGFGMGLLRLPLPWPVVH